MVVLAFSRGAGVTLVERRCVQVIGFDLEGVFGGITRPSFSMRYVGGGGRGYTEGSPGTAP